MIENKDLKEIARKLGVETQILGMASEIMERIFSDETKTLEALDSIEAHCKKGIKLVNEAKTILSVLRK